MIDFAKIPFLDSPNHKTRGGAKVTHVVIHAMIGTMAGTAHLFKTPHKTSAHYGVSRKGEIVQYVKDEEEAMHVCQANPFTLGIEHEDLYFDANHHLIGGGNNINLTPWWTDVQLNSSAQLVVHLMKKFNIPIEHVIGHNNPFLHKYGNDHQDPGKIFPWPKYRLLLASYFNEVH